MYWLHTHCFYSVKTAFKSTHMLTSNGVMFTDFPRKDHMTNLSLFWKLRVHTWWRVCCFPKWQQYGNSTFLYTSWYLVSMGRWVKFFRGKQRCSRQTVPLCSYKLKHQQQVVTINAEQHMVVTLWVSLPFTHTHTRTHMVGKQWWLFGPFHWLWIASLS